MEYRSAHDFYRDLRIQFGESARSVALSYLDTISAQSRRTGKDDPDEMSFCRDLYRIVFCNV